MGNPVTILSTASGDTGSTYTLKNRELMGGKGTYVNAEVASGDTIVLEGKLLAANDFVILATFTADALVVVDLPTIYRGRRTVDGGSDSTLTIQTPDITGVV